MSEDNRKLILSCERDKMTMLYAEYGELIISGTRVQQRLQQLTGEIVQQEKKIKELENGGK